MFKLGAKVDTESLKEPHFLITYFKINIKNGSSFANPLNFIEINMLNQLN